MSKQKQYIVFYDNDKAHLEVVLNNDSVWLSLNQMSALFDKDKSVISRHINNVFNEKELKRSATVAKNATVQNEGERAVSRDIDYFNLDVIISVGYRVKSQKGTQFRIWANKIIKDHLVGGYSINEDRLQQLKKTIQLITCRKSNGSNCFSQLVMK